MIIAIFLVLAVFLVIDYILDKRFFSPIKIFNVVWLIVFGLYQMNLSYIQTDFTLQALTVFMVCIVGFDLAYLGYVIAHKKLRFCKKKEEDRHLLFQKYNGKISVKSKLKIINIVFILLFAIEVLYSKNIPLISLFIGKSSNYTEFGIPSLNGLMYGVAICVGAYYIYRKNPRALIYISFGLLIVSRQLLIAMIVETLVVFVCRRLIDSKNKIKHLALKIIVIVGVIVVGFTMLGNFRSGNDEMKNIFEPRSEYKNLPVAVMWTYSYTEFSFSNFNKLTKIMEGGKNYGASTLNALLPTVLTRTLKIKENEKPYYLVRSNFTVSTWFPEIYLDFGVIGVLVFSILVGFLGAKLYRNVLANNCVENSLLYAMFVHNIAFFFFTNMFLYLPVISQIVLIPLIFRGEDEEQK